MKYLQSIQLNEHSKEEILPDFSPDFPYISTCAELDRYAEPTVPWHWHRAVELFYMESGTLEYTTPAGTYRFPPGSGGFVNSNVLHTTRPLPSEDGTVQLLHLFDPAFLAGSHGSRIETKYILPLTAAGTEVIPLSPEDPAQAKILEEIRAAFHLSAQDWGYEFRLRQALTSIWLKLLACLPHDAAQTAHSTDDAKIKALMIYVHEHFHQPLSVEQLARAAAVSKRACFRLFRRTLHMTPTEYIRSRRLQEACRLLSGSNISITQVADSCGFESAGYFGRVFRETFGCSPKEYRARWHDRDKKRR